MKFTNKPVESNICGHIWKINFVDEFCPALHLNDALCYGTCIENFKSIYISNKCPKENITEILIHELSHAILDETQLNRSKESYTNEEVAVFMQKNAVWLSENSREIIKMAEIKERNKK